MDKVYVIKETIYRGIENVKNDVRFDYTTEAFSSIELAKDYLHNKYVDSLEKGFYRHINKDETFLSLKRKDKPIRIVYEILTLDLHYEGDL